MLTTRPHPPVRAGGSHLCLVLPLLLAQALQLFLQSLELLPLGSLAALLLSQLGLQTRNLVSATGANGDMCINYSLN